MNNINAVIGLEQMKHIDFIVNSHKENGKLYDDNLNNNKIQKLYRPPESESSHWIYSLLVEDRDSFQKYMKNNGIGCSPVHVRNDQYSIFKDFRTRLAGCDHFCSRMVNIPVGWWLTPDEKTYIIETINNY